MERKLVAFGACPDEPGFHEFARITRPGGRIALVLALDANHDAFERAFAGAVRTLVDPHSVVIIATRT